MSLETISKPPVLLVRVSLLMLAAKSLTRSVALESQNMGDTNN